MQKRTTPGKPEILAPAGDTASFLAAAAAGADAVYLGLKHFSARMEAQNFGLTELARLTDLAHQNGMRIYAAMNTLIKPRECAASYRLARVLGQMGIDGLIVQDLAFLDIALQAGFRGGLFLSTLANVSHPNGLASACSLGASRVILPRELSIDEIKLMASACPEGLELECFVHGALCYCVSGRCYWSSYMGGKSGLRGRCVQPCRRLYRQGGRIEAAQDTNGKRKSALRKERSAHFFSSRDLSLDVLVKTLLPIPHLAAWKIEGRKKGPYYVFHVVTAYRMLRDNPSDPQAKKDATDILGMALGRAATHARFLPQKACSPTDPDGLSCSGLFVGKTRTAPGGQTLFKTRTALLPQDYLRVGMEDERWHTALPVTRGLPRGGEYVLRLPRHKTPPAGTPVFLIDRREPELQRLLLQWRQKLDAVPGKPAASLDGVPQMPLPDKRRHKKPDMRLFAILPTGKQHRVSPRQMAALWLSRRSVAISRTVAIRVAWWLPPVIWPQEEELFQRFIERLWHDGCRHFVCNAPWQRAFFPEKLPADADILAGPFCNTANACALGILERLGFSGAMISPELSREDTLSLPGQSPLPLGFLLSGFWPVGISRYGVPGFKRNEPFCSPKGEIFWGRQYGENLWLYPGWPLNLEDKRPELQEAGYAFFVHMQEKPPHCLPQPSRPGLFNWDTPLL